MSKPTEMKSFTLRLPASLADELATVADVDSVPVQQAVRDAITEHIEARRRTRRSRSACVPLHSGTARSSSGSRAEPWPRSST